jgi:hypothetical protein
MRARPAAVFGPVDSPPWKRHLRLPGSTLTAHGLPCRLRAPQTGRSFRGRGEQLPLKPSACSSRQSAPILQRCEPPAASMTIKAIVTDGCTPVSPTASNEFSRSGRHSNSSPESCQDQACPVLAGRRPSEQFCSDRGRTSGHCTSKGRLGSRLGFVGDGRVPASDYIHPEFGFFCPTLSSQATSGPGVSCPRGGRRSCDGHS